MILSIHYIAALVSIHVEFHHFFISLNAPTYLTRVLHSLKLADTEKRALLLCPSHRALSCLKDAKVFTLLKDFECLNKSFLQCGESLHFSRDTDRFKELSVWTKRYYFSLLDVSMCVAVFPSPLPFCCADSRLYRREASGTLAMTFVARFFRGWTAAWFVPASDANGITSASIERLWMHLEKHTDPVLQIMLEEFLRISYLECSWTFPTVQGPFETLWWPLFRLR
jgi:hypothetical protein